MPRTSFLEWPELDFSTALARTMQPFFRTLPGGHFVPPVEVFKKAGELHVKVELPGIDPEKDVSVTVEDGYLVIAGERKETAEAKEEGYYRKETLHGIFERRIPIPAGIKETAIKAAYKHGILEVVLPAVEPAEPKPRRIAINAS